MKDHVEEHVDFPVMHVPSTAEFSVFECSPLINFVSVVHTRTTIVRRDRFSC